MGGDPSVGATPEHDASPGKPDPPGFVLSTSPLNYLS